MLGLMIFEFLIGFAVVMCIKNGDTNNVGFAVFVLFFIVISALLISEIVKRIINIRTSLVGVETYGLVVRAREEESHTKHGIQITWYVDVMLQDEAGNISQYTECMGDSCKYGVGEFVRLKHCKNDINILESVGDWEVPDALRNKLTAEMEEPGSYLYNEFDLGYDSNPEKIVIDGVEYTRKR